MIQVDPDYEPDTNEIRTIFGVSMEQRRNDAVIDGNLFNQKNVVVTANPLTEAAVRDLIVATIALKYTQSNSVCYAKNGQVIGIGAGQQSRIHCTRLAGEKADNWWLRQHPKITNAVFKKNVKRAEISNLVDAYVNGIVGTEMPMEMFNNSFENPPPLLTEVKNRCWILQLTNLSLSLFSDGTQRMDRPID